MSLWAWAGAGGDDALSVWDRRELAAGGALLLGLVIARRFFGRPRSSFAVEPGPWAPGRRVRGTFLCARKPEAVRGVLALFPAGGGSPVRSVPAEAGEAKKHDDGWRVPVSAVLPEDARPSFEGGWTLSVEARSRGHVLEASDEVLLAGPDGGEDREEEESVDLR